MIRYLPHIALVASALVLGSALLSQFAGGLAPCKMCIWQRWPHAIAITLLLLGILMGGSNRRIVLALAGVIFLIGAGIGVFHAGVEWGYWEGPGSCTGGGVGGLSTEQLLEQIMNAPLVRCDEIAWDFLGLSMAGWNAVCSIILAGLAFVAAKRG